MTKKARRLEDEPLTAVWCSPLLGPQNYHAMVAKWAEVHYAAPGRWMYEWPLEDYETVILGSLEF
jgi:hypothetical protein